MTVSPEKLKEAFSLRSELFGVVNAQMMNSSSLFFQRITKNFDVCAETKLWRCLDKGGVFGFRWTLGKPKSSKNPRQAGAEKWTRENKGPNGRNSGGGIDSEG